MSERTYDRMMENRLAKMREGQAAGEIVDFDDEGRCVIVPLTDGEWLKALSLADQLVTEGTEAGFLAREEYLKSAVLLFACREMRNYEEFFFNTIEEVQTLGHHEITRVHDEYLEMVAAASPPFLAMSDEDLEALKKVWEQIEWSELSGRQWYAARRFLNLLNPASRQGNSFGLRSTRSLTTKSTDESFAGNARESTTTQE